MYKKLLKIVKIKYGYIKNFESEEKEDDKEDIKLLKHILREQKSILHHMYYSIHKKWINMMETDLDDEKMKQLFILE